MVGIAGCRITCAGCCISRRGSSRTLSANSKGGVERERFDANEHRAGARAAGEGHASDAIQTLRDAYMAPLDGMGRYVPRSEMDFWMSRAFVTAGQRDSAERYAKFVRTAWAKADPVMRARVDSPARNYSIIVGR